MLKDFYIYILSNKKEGVLYIGVTANLIKRIWIHREGLVKGFTKKYNLKLLVYYEHHGLAESAIYREKKLKRWRRQWKLDLINSFNPNWNDLYETIVQ
jgi:putative endonuclease